MGHFPKPTWRSAAVALALAAWASWPARGQDAPVEAPASPPPAEEPAARAPVNVPPPATVTMLIAGRPVQPIDLNTALRLAGVQNPELNVARTRVMEAAALRMQAAAAFLPTLNPGMNYDTHTGVLQQSNGNILTVNRSAVYVGAGSNAVAAGTVNIPGVVLSGNLGAGIYAYLATRQVVQQRSAAAVGVRNQVFLRVALAYSELIRAEGHLAVARQVYDESSKIARLTASYAEAGEGRQADADRAEAELANREAELRQAEGAVLAASARLAQVINVDPSVRLHPTDAYAVPLPIVPDPIPVHELIAIALLQRPELAERRAAIRAALLALDGAKILPFSPNALIGFSSGGFGGGSNLVRPIFGGFGTRSDLDVVAYWSIQNMGLGNVALINRAKAALQTRRFEEIAVLNMVRAEVAESYALTHARFAQIATLENAVRAGLGAFQRDYERIRNRAAAERRDVLPIELLNSFRLLARSRKAYLDAIVDYNEAQFSLFVALGQPPADVLARPVPSDGIAPSNVGSPTPEGPPPPAGEPGPFAPGADNAAGAGAPAAAAANDAANPEAPRPADVSVSRAGPPPARREDPELRRVALPR
jgi:outer membrane protein TolC